MSTRIILSLICAMLVLPAGASNPLANQVQQLNQAPIANDANLWQRMRNGFMLDHRATREVKYWEQRYGSPKYFNIIMQNASPYLYFVVAELERRGLPTELALIPIVESTYNPNAVSPAAISTGMWQFIASSGRRFGLTLNSDLDERKDIIKSTRAAITYFQYLHDLFGSWELAIAAYNWGEGNINGAINKSNSRNFYDLDVRDVTRQYVPKVIALANIISNPRRFGINLIDLPNKPYFAVITPSAPTKLGDFVNQAQLSPAINRKLNPQFASLNYLVQPSQRLLAPLANQSLYLAAHGKANNIARNDASSPAFADDDGINQLAMAVSDNSQASAPTAPPPSPSTNAATTNFISYTVTAGDTLYSIARKFAVPLDLLKSDNQLVDNNIKLNQKLLIRNTGLNS